MEKIIMQGRGLTILMILFGGVMYAQIHGTVKGTDGLPLPYANIFVDEYKKGSVSNLEGEYSLDLPRGIYTLEFRYIGFKSEFRKVEVDGKPILLDVILQEEAVFLDEVTISADAEDPAYAVMRKAIKARDKNHQAITTYQGDLYIKGLVKVLAAPDKFMGMNIGNMEGLLDTTGSGIVYLSESQTDVYFQAPDRLKEVMRSGVIAGDDNGFSFNQYSGASFNFYRQIIEFDRSLISPLHNNSISHYKFSMQGVLYDEKGRLINKISVIPRNDAAGLFSGTLYILEDSWSIHSLDLSFTGKAMKNRMFDFIRIRQIMNKDNATGVWYKQSQIIDFQAAFFTFRFGGTFSYFFQDIRLNETIPEGTFNAEVFSVDASALKHSMEYWDSIRPIPLTRDEKVDYIKKDSLKILRESRSYMDSIDRINNEWKWTSLLFGYTHNKTYKSTSVKAGYPLSLLRFNAVEGWAIGSRLTYTRFYNDDNNRLQISAVWRYGFADKRWKFLSEGNYLLNRKSFAWITAGAGRENFQFDERGVAPLLANTLSSILYKDNFIRLFEKSFAFLGIQGEPLNGVYLWHKTSFERRSPLENNSNFSFFRKDRDYASNHPFHPIADDPVFEPHDALFLDFSVRWRPGQKYMTFPSFKVRVSSDWPEFFMNYRKAVPVSPSGIDFDRLLLRLRHRKINMHTMGYGTINLEFGTFLRNGVIEFPDYFHFIGGEGLLNFHDRYVFGFKVMPFYMFSTENDYTSLVYEHHFDGFLLDRIPILKNSGLKSVLGLGLMHSGNKKYYEVSFGFENIGIGSLSMFRIDYGLGFTPGGLINHGPRLGLSRMISNFLD